MLDFLLRQTECAEMAIGNMTQLPYDQALTFLASCGPHVVSQFQTYKVSVTEQMVNCIGRRMPMWRATDEERERYCGVIFTDQTC